MPRFVLLRHECPPSLGKPSHWDFMLEWGDGLRTWNLYDLPLAWARAFQVEGDQASVAAVSLPEHRIAYLDYEGPVSGNRGVVRRCDRGTYELLHQEPNRLRISLQGSAIVGVVELVASRDDWTLAARDR